MPLKFKRGGTALSGVLLVDKPLGWTSHDLVRKLRFLTGEGRVGHCGTLDPDASGLMIMLIGHATTLSNEFMLDDKSYLARISFGMSTTTDDAQGDLVESAEVSEEVFSQEYARGILKSFLGDSEQIPPDFSALKVEGKKSYKEARKGRSLQLKARPITVFTAELLEVDKETQSWFVHFKVSKGSYIRALARDIGLAVGSRAHLSELRRTQSGDFNLEDAYSVDELSSACQARLIEDDETTKEHFESDNPLGIADLFLPRETLLKSITTKKLTAASVSGARVAPAVATIGVFDGVHRGHQALLKRIVQRAKGAGLLSVVMTFDSHPQGVLRPLSSPVALMTIEEKIEAIKSCGIDEVVVLPFNHKMSQEDAEDFLLQTMLAMVQVQEVIVGSNFRCGKGASCGPDEMKKILDRANIPVTVMELEADKQGIPYSSTRLRQRIE